MNINGFRSWLAYFHDLNQNYYLYKEERYHRVPEGDSQRTIIGYKHIWKVIENSCHEQVYVPMMDRKFQQYTLSGCNIDNEEFTVNSRSELNVIRYALLLRRIMEYSIGKPFKSEQQIKSDTKTTKFQVLWRKREKKQTQYNQYRNQRHNIINIFLIYTYYKSAICCFTLCNTIFFD